MIVFGKESIDLIKEVSSKVFGSVAHTLGPNGSNSLIIKDGKPTITNDGVSIVNSITFDKEEENLILSLIKSSISNTESKVGDGTTSTTILLYHIIKECIDRIQDGENPILLRNKILDELKIIKERISDYSSNIETEDDVKNIANISNGGYEDISEMLKECFNKSKAINLELNENSDDMTIEHISGFIVNSKSIIKRDKVELTGKLLVIMDNSISPEDLKSLMELKRQKDFPLVILIGKVNEELNQLLNIYSKVDNLYVYNLPEFGNRRNEIIKAISYICNNVTINKKNSISSLEINKRLNILGDFKGILTENNIIFTELQNEQTVFLKMKLPFKREELENGVIKIKVGAPTEAQALELFYRIEDSINSINKSLEKGYVSGAGSVLYDISKDDRIIILKSPLKSITNQLILNNGLKVEDYEKMLNEAEKDFGFNAKNNTIVNLKKHGIIDPTITVLSSIENAVNIASSIITVKNINLNK